jgi:hypothetical protein
VLFGAGRHCLARRADLLGEGGSLLLLPAQGFSQFGNNGVGCLLLLHSIIDSFLQLYGLRFDLSAGSQELV